jgi:hypothetical protein
MNGNGVTDRATGWVGRWLVRLGLYTVYTWPFVTLVYLPYLILVVGFSWHQLTVYLLTSLPFSLLAYVAIAPWGRYVWQSIWRIQHGVRPFWRESKGV